MSTGTAVIIGAGSGLSASLARQLDARGLKLVLAARDTEKLKDLAKDTAAHGSNGRQRPCRDGGLV